MKSISFFRVFTKREKYVEVLVSVPPETLLPLDGFCTSGTNFVCLLDLPLLKATPAEFQKAEEISMNKSE